MIVRYSKTSLRDAKFCRYQSSVQTKATAAIGQENWDI